MPHLLRKSKAMKGFWTLSFSSVSTSCFLCCSRTQSALRRAFSVRLSTLKDIHFAEIFLHSSTVDRWRSVIIFSIFCSTRNFIKQLPNFSEKRLTSGLFLRYSCQYSWIFRLIPSQVTSFSSFLDIEATETAVDATRPNLKLDHQLLRSLDKAWNC